MHTFYIIQESVDIQGPIGTGRPCDGYFIRYVIAHTSNLIC